MIDTSGSPGAKCTSAKHTSATPNIMGKVYKTRWNIKLSIQTAFKKSLNRSLALDDGDQTK
jgi:hypothetical protein